MGGMYTNTFYWLLNKRVIIVDSMISVLLLSVFAKMSVAQCNNFCSLIMPACAYAQVDF